MSLNQTHSRISNALIILAIGITSTAMIMDLTDTANFQQYMSSNLVEISPLVAYISLMHSQISLCRFVILLVAVLIKSNDPTSVFCHFRGFKLPKELRIPRRIWFRLTCVLVLVIVRFVISFVKFTQYANAIGRYSAFIVRVEHIRIYSAVIIATTSFCDIFVQFLFACVCCAPVDAVKHCKRHITKVTKSFKVKSYTWDEFAKEIVYIRDEYESIIETVDHIDCSFGWLVVISIIGDVLEILSVVASLSLYAFSPQEKILYRIIRDSLTLGILTVQLWNVMEFPIRLHKLGHSLGEKLEILVYCRQQTRQTMPTVEEYNMMKSLAERGHSGRLTVSAGGLFHFTPNTVVTVLMAGIGFLVFAVDRMQNTQAVLKTENIVLTILNSNMTPAMNISSYFL